MEGSNTGLLGRRFLCLPPQPRAPWGGWVTPACTMGTVSPHCWGEVSGTGISLPLCLPFHPGSKGGHIGWREEQHHRDAPGKGRKVSGAGRSARQQAVRPVRTKEEML